MNELIKIEEEKLVEVFTGGCIDTVLDAVKERAVVVNGDLSTAKGRGEYASMANKVAKTKVAIDKIGKNLVADWKAKAKAVDQVRKKARDFLDELKSEVRKPLTEWETEQKRIRAEEEERKRKEEEARLEAIRKQEEELRRKEEELRKKAAELEAEKERAQREECIKAEAEERAKKEAELRVQIEKEKVARLEAEKAMAKQSKTLICPFCERKVVLEDGILKKGGGDEK